MRLRPNDTSAAIITYSAAADSRKRGAPVLSIAPPPHSPPHRHRLHPPTPPLTGTNPRTTGPCWPACLPVDRLSSGHSRTRINFNLVSPLRDIMQQTARYGNCASLLGFRSVHTITVPRNRATQRFEAIGCFVLFFSSEIDKSPRGGN